MLQKAELQAGIGRKMLGMDRQREQTTPGRRKQQSSEHKG